MFYNIPFEYKPIVQHPTNSTEEPKTIGYRVMHDGINLGHLIKVRKPGRTYFVANRKDRRVHKKNFRSLSEGAIALYAAKQYTN